MSNETKDTPSQAALAAAEELHGEFSVDWWLTVAHKSLQYQNLFEAACRERERIARIIDKHIAQLAETNGNALADMTQAHSDARDVWHSWQGRAERAEQQLARAEASLAECQMNCECESKRADAGWDKVREVQHDLAQSQAREASLARALNDAEHRADIAERDSGLYCGTLRIAAHQLGCDDHVVDHAVKDVLNREASLVEALKHIAFYDAPDVHAMINQVYAALARHQAAVDSVGITDTQRLEYLIKEEACVLERLDDEEGGEEFEVYRERSLSPVAGGPNPRAAINAAIEASAESSGNKRAGEST